MSNATRDESEKLIQEYDRKKQLSERKTVEDILKGDLKDFQKIVRDQLRKEWEQQKKEQKTWRWFPRSTPSLNNYLHRVNTNFTDREDEQKLNRLPIENNNNNNNDTNFTIGFIKCCTHIVTLI